MSGTRRKPGRMSAYIAGFGAWLLAAAYTPGTVRNMLKDAGHLGRWMERADIEAAQLDWDLVQAFRRARSAQDARRVPGVRAFRPLMEYLEAEGVIAPAMFPSTPVSEVVASYHTWLARRGLAPATVVRYENLARRFLQERYDGVGAEFVENLASPDVTAFLLRECGRVSLGAAKGRVGELRALLRFLFAEGLMPRALAASVPPVAGWRDTALPAGPSAREVQMLLDGCDREDPVGARDHAILMLVARLGLRSIEVSRLQLDDIDWRAGEIVVRGKARRQDRLPLPWDVGEALSTYLYKARPQAPLRQVFLACKAPRRPIRPDLVSDVARRACQRAGLAPAGAHRLRHALATEMLRRGATLVEVSQVLRHRDLATTAIYAKVDHLSLREIAKPWPGAAK
jgi:site-specific recombinase XerD